MGKTPKPNNACSLHVNRPQFLDALRQIKQLDGLSGDAVFMLEHRQLRVDLGPFSFRADAFGTWHGQATVPARFIRSLALEPPAGIESIEVVCNGKCLEVDGRSVRCEWESVERPRITVPLGASLLEILAMRKRYSAEEITESDIEKTIRNAETKALFLLRKAAKVLQPLLFTSNDLTKILDEKAAAVARNEKGSSAGGT